MSSILLPDIKNNRKDASILTWGLSRIFTDDISIIPIKFDVLSQRLSDPRHVSDIRPSSRQYNRMETKTLRRKQQKETRTKYKDRYGVECATLIRPVDCKQGKTEMKSEVQ